MLNIEKINENAVIPKRSNPSDSGLDLSSVEDIVIESGEVKLVPTGWKMAVPPGYEIQIRPRSGLALRNKITVLNTPGTVDSSYRGEVKVIMFNAGKDPFIIKVKDRIAQMVINKIELWNPVIVGNLPETVRGEDGFGSTGV